jgi:hypothetical protein
MGGSKSRIIHQKNNLNRAKAIELDSFFLPFNVLFSYTTPAVSAYGKALISIIDVNLNVRVFAFTIPRIFTVFSQFTS